MSNLVQHFRERPIRLQNVNCPYCGRNFGDGVVATKEHVIGRRFVPKGALEAQWNLILNACSPCNNAKAELENDISVITMLSTHSISDLEVQQRLSSEYERRAHKTGSRRTGKSVASSHETVQVQEQHSNASATFNFSCGPQIDHRRIHRLAELHFRAFRFLCTFNKSTNRGFAGGNYVHLGAYRRANWGAVEARWFMQKVQSWELRACGIAADGYFKINIQKCPTAKIWSCALEWNQTLRVLAFAGEMDEIENFLSGMPASQSIFKKTPEGDLLRLTADIPLDVTEDTLFYPAGTE